MLILSRTVTIRLVLSPVPVNRATELMLIKCVLVSFLKIIKVASQRLLILSRTVTIHSVLSPVGIDVLVFIWTFICFHNLCF